ncbi:hypothetical protein Zmor_016153 [Zophobas morio]|uniref:Peptidase S1 domain-containing protein n=1 Tax=Zophobas morio TaxID=2755281 RepID=A0AA38MI79_9CUCU|nr:hypothetical protein Zmor_016153 [Zophobas morio]
MSCQKSPTLLQMSYHDETKSRIIGGTEARAGQFPSAAAIYSTTSGGTYFCGGSLVSRQHVLTAAHCVISGFKYEVVLGSNSLQGSASNPNRVIVAATSRIIHPYYNYQTLQNDIAILIFHLPIELTDYIQPINLPTEEVVDNVETVAIGWGQTDDATAGLASQLNYVTVSTISNTECQLSFTDVIFDNMVCAAGNYNEGTCNGDSGGPLILEVDNKQYHVGISSFISNRGCESTDPSGYTRTFPYAGWVRNHIGVN